MNDTTTTKAIRVWNKAKATPDEFSGVDATHLTPADRKALAVKGLSFSENRKNKIIAVYPSRLRQEDLRKSVSKHQ